MEQQELLERKQDKLKEVLAFFEHVQADFRLKPSLSESLFYGEDDGCDDMVVQVTHATVETAQSSRQNTPVGDRLDTQENKDVQ